MYTLRFRPESVQDIQSGRDWYAAKATGLGDSFIDEFWAAIDRIAERPLSFAALPTGLRPCRLRRFSYVIQFRVTETEILVVALMNAARDDSAYQDRR